MIFFLVSNIIFNTLYPFRKETIEFRSEYIIVDKRRVFDKLWGAGKGWSEIRSKFIIDFNFSQPNKVIMTGDFNFFFFSFNCIIFDILYICMILMILFRSLKYFLNSYFVP